MGTNCLCGYRHMRIQSQNILGTVVDAPRRAESFAASEWTVDSSKRKRKRQFFGRVRVNCH